MKLSLLTRDRIQSLNKRRYLQVQIGDFGESRFRSLTSAELRSLKSLLQNADGSLNRDRAEHMQELLLCATLVDESNELLYCTEDAFGGCWNDVDGHYVTLAFRAAQRWTGFLLEEDTEAIEIAIKNSRAAQSNGSPE